MPSDRSAVLLAVFAHPDDEFAIFPWIEHAVREGIEVHAVWLTDGGWGGQDIVRRQQESVGVLKALGVKRENMHFEGARLEIADGDLYRSLEPVTDAILTLARRLGRVEVMAPAWEGGHQDHDAAHLVGLSLIQATGATGWEYSLYNGYRLPGPMFNVLSPIPRQDEVQTLRTSLRQRLECIFRCLRFRSQWKSFLGLLPLYTWKLLRADAFVRRPIRPELTSSRPHAGALLYERRTGLSWDAFAAETAAFRAARGPSEPGPPPD
ncbi:PIG-L family deacetylase [Pseudoxanthomonas sp. SL93]|jgi:LmbE family N-acetylglucosaminyl deacetylase|uniref:PIG-L deacetylase family protein n=1 Tax=Pseudoxanthomonas sp. SL93 TaxID=2995142 RepID=UPI0022709CC2|nr:PIG-L family deacetylase [Pseudoxanthomonas sp. SL93]WAC63035.1 PIG-L family deacetylase [Pseudoxanthomonas sp. SL93]